MYWDSDMREEAKGKRVTDMREDTDMREEAKGKRVRREESPYHPTLFPGESPYHPTPT
jgi:hypothetical protein